MSDWLYLMINIFWLFYCFNQSNLINSIHIYPVHLPFFIFLSNNLDHFPFDVSNRNSLFLDFDFVLLCFILIIINLVLIFVVIHFLFLG